MTRKTSLQKKGKRALQCSLDNGEGRSTFIFDVIYEVRARAHTRESTLQRRKSAGYGHRFAGHGRPGSSGSVFPDRTDCGQIRDRTAVGSEATGPGCRYQRNREAGAPPIGRIPVVRPVGAGSCSFGGDGGRGTVYIVP